MSHPLLHSSPIPVGHRSEGTTGQRIRNHLSISFARKGVPPQTCLWCRGHLQTFLISLSISQPPRTVVGPWTWCSNLIPKHLHFQMRLLSERGVSHLTNLSLLCAHALKSSLNLVRFPIAPNQRYQLSNPLPGLETLGIMHPHWHSTSPGVQQRLISLYLLSLASTSPDGVASPTSPTALTTFESELQYSRSPHDVAALLRWGLRHLRLEGDSFGKESGDWTWYSTFAEAERAGSYPPDAFSNSLVPQLPSAHTELLLATLDIISSLSTRSEANGSSGSKLSKFFGLWLLTSEQSMEGDDWSAFYDRWDRAGRILEHLFLARIRFVSVVFEFPIITSDGHTYIVMMHLVYLEGSLILLSTTLTTMESTYPRTICFHVHDSQHGNSMHCSCS